jgi:branched-chain amino acid aminotransferase
MQRSHVHLNGRITPADQAVISLFDVGLLRGYAVFDLLRTIHGRPFLLAEHLRRFRASAEYLNLRVPATDEEIAGAIGELLARNGHAEATVRLLLTGGISPNGMGFDPETPTFAILTHELPELPARIYESGGKLITEEHQREIPEAKTTNYLTMLRNLPRVERAGALDVLYHAGGRVSEAASASFYVVRDGTVVAPRDRVLPGTVGTFVLGLAKERYEMVHEDVSLEDAYSADEAFLTSTTRGIVPIVQLDDRPIGNGVVGPVTRDLMSRFRKAAFGEE